MPNGTSHRARPRLYALRRDDGEGAQGIVAPGAFFIAKSDQTGQALGLLGRGVFGGASPGGHGPAGWKQRTRPLNRLASGQAAAKATRTREAVSVIRAAILIKRIWMVLNSAMASGCSFGMLSRTFSNSQ